MVDASSRHRWQPLTVEHEDGPKPASPIVDALLVLVILMAFVASSRSLEADSTYRESG